MNIFDSLAIYAQPWNQTAERNFSAEEINAVASAKVVSSQYGNSVCFIMKSGGQTYIPLSRDSQAGLGDTIDLSKATLVTLSRQGEADITRVKA